MAGRGRHACARLEWSRGWRLGRSGRERLAGIFTNAKLLGVGTRSWEVEMELKRI